MHNKLKNELLRMVDEDYQVKEQLAKEGSLFEGYHPKMEEVHIKNGQRMEAIIEKYGWPGKSLVGEDGVKAAWLIVQHAISMPMLQRKCLSLLKEKVKEGEIPLEEVAMLEDRIRIFEGKKQIYGTQFDWDENGEMSPYPIENPEIVNKLRQSIGLPSLEVTTKKHQEYLKKSNERPPKDRAATQKAFEEWVRKVGWRNS